MKMVWKKWRSHFRKRTFILLFTLALTLTIVLSSGSFSLSQNSQPTTKEEFIEKIETWAVDHAQIGEQLYLNEVSDEFKDNAFGLDSTEIKEIYTKKFKEEKERLEKSFWEQLPDGLGWLTASLLFCLLIFKDVLQTKFTELTEALWDWAYLQIAGSPWFSNLGLQKYQKALQERLTNLDTPFKINPPLAMAEVYVPLKVKEVSEEEGKSDRQRKSISNTTTSNQPPASLSPLPRGTTGGNLSTRGTISQGNELDIYEAMGHYKRLMITGAPGSGKSVLLKHIAFTYSEDRLDLPGQPIPLRLELNSLRDGDLNEESFVAKLVEVLDNNGFPKAQHFIAQALDKGQLMLLLDGLDEVPSEIRDNVVTVINEFLEKYSDCRAIITCRTAVYEHEFDVVLNRNLLEVVEFTDYQIRNFLQAWKSRMPADKSVEQLMQTLQDRPKIKTLARNPLLLTIITYLYTETTFVLPHSRAEFYEKATNMLLELRDQERNIPNRYSAVAKRQILRRLALTAQDTLDPSNPDRRSIPHTAVRNEIRQILPNLDLDSEDTELILQEIIDRSGLLLEIDGGEQYQFAHLTLQEFFAAAALQNQGDELINRFETDTVAWREVVKLWCGLAGNSTNLIQKIYSQDILLAFECLADAQEVAQTLASQIITQMQQALPRAATEDEVARAFGAVAADIKPRGQAVLSFLQEQLTTASDLETRKAAANALSMTNLPKAAKVLVERYEQARDEVAEPLIRMGDVAVKPLAEVANKGRIGAIDDLFLINTPNAAKALAPMLWHNDNSLASHAAWRLAALLPQSSVEEELKTIENLPKSHSLDWLWSPFEQFRGSSLSIITGQIAQLIVANPKPLTITYWATGKIITPIADPRLLIPLCSFQEKPVDPLTIKDKDLTKIKNLLEGGSDIGTKLGDKDRRMVTNLLLTPANVNSNWGALIREVNSSLQLDLLYRLVTGYRSPEKQDWLNLFKPTQEFQFGKSFNYLIRHLQNINLW